MDKDDTLSSVFADGDLDSVPPTPSPVKGKGKDGVDDEDPLPPEPVVPTVPDGKPRAQVNSDNIKFFFLGKWVFK